MNHQYARIAAIMRTMPPTTPRTIAPIGVLLLIDDLCVMVMVLLVLFGLGGWIATIFSVKADGQTHGATVD